MVGRKNGGEKDVHVRSGDLNTSALSLGRWGDTMGGYGKQKKQKEHRHKAGPEAYQGWGREELLGGAATRGDPPVRVERAPEAHGHGGCEESQARHPRLEGE